MKVVGFWPKIITTKPARYLIFDSWTVLVRHSQARKCLQINLKLTHQIAILLACYTHLATYLYFQTSINWARLQLQTWFLHNQHLFTLRCAFSPTTAATVLASWCYLCTPLKRRGYVLIFQQIMGRAPLPCACISEVKVPFITNEALGSWRPKIKL